MVIRWCGLGAAQDQTVGAGAPLNTDHLQIDGDAALKIGFESAVEIDSIIVITSELIAVGIEKGTQGIGGAGGFGAIGPWN